VSILLNRRRAGVLQWAEEFHSANERTYNFGLWVDNVDNILLASYFQGYADFTSRRTSLLPITVDFSRSYLKTGNVTLLGNPGPTGGDYLFFFFLHHCKYQIYFSSK
jgi:hypothetical protein